MENLVQAFIIFFQLRNQSKQLTLVYTVSQPLLNDDLVDGMLTRTSHVALIKPLLAPDSISNVSLVSWNQAQQHIPSSTIVPCIKAIAAFISVAEFISPVMWSSTRIPFLSPSRSVLPRPELPSHLYYHASSAQL